MHHCTQLRRRVGRHRRASEAPSAHPLYNSAVHCLCDAVAKATAEKGQLTLVSCFAEPHTPLSLQSVLILKREPSPEGPNAVFPSRQSPPRPCCRPHFWDPPGTPNSMKNAPANIGAHRCAKKVHMWPPVRAKVCPSDPKVAKMEPKWRPGTLPKVVLYADRVKNGPICDRYIICYVFITSALPKTPHFCYLFATPKW